MQTPLHAPRANPTPLRSSLPPPSSTIAHSYKNLKLECKLCYGVCTIEVSMGTIHDITYLKFIQEIYDIYYYQQEFLECE